MVNHWKPLYGFTLMEMLIAGFLGSVLVLGMSYLIGASWQAFRYQTSLTDSEEAARTFFAVIEQNLELARATDTFPVNWAVSSSSDSGSDRLGLAYLSSARSDRNCLGNQESGTIVNTYYIRPAADSPFQTNDVMCTANSRSDTIVQHIVLMKVRYGVDKGQFVNGIFVDRPDGLVDGWTTQVNEARLHKVVSMDIMLITQSRFRDKSIAAALDNVWGRSLGDFGIDTKDGYFRWLHTARFNFVS